MGRRADWRGGWERRREEGGSTGTERHVAGHGGGLRRTSALTLTLTLTLTQGMEETYATMSETVLQGLRRRLPVTRVKFDWENKASVHKLASELQKK